MNSELIPIPSSELEFDTPAGTNSCSKDCNFVPVQKNGSYHSPDQYIHVYTAGEETDKLRSKPPKQLLELEMKPTNLICYCMLYLGTYFFCREDQRMTLSGTAMLRGSRVERDWPRSLFIISQVYLSIGKTSSRGTRKETSTVMQRPSPTPLGPFAQCSTLMMPCGLWVGTSAPKMSWKGSTWFRASFKRVKYQ